MQGNKMINQFSKTIWLVLVAAFVVAGCEQGQKEETSVYELLTDPNFVMPEYASRAIGATGGPEAWTKAKKLEFDCVVTLYKPDGSFYLTEQHHEIHPWSSSIRISALEPQGKFVCQLSGGIFSVSEGAVLGTPYGEQVDALPIAIENRDFAEAILDITTAPVRLLDKPFAFTKGPQPVKIEGQWYYPVERVRIFVGALPYWSKVVFYQNTDTSRVDMLWFVGAGEKKLLAVRGYDYKEVEKRGILVPAKIEIFRTDADGVLRERLVKIDY
jgi:nitrite reductase/ring-hydroxylating ferredoxin subunit